MYKMNGTHTYAQIGLEASVMNASPHQLVTMLFEGARSAILRAEILMDKKDIAGKGKSISHAILIIDGGLRDGLSRENGDPALVDNLEALYSYMVQRLLHANLHNDKSALHEVLHLLDDVADAWRQIGPDYHAQQDQYHGSISVSG
jgi:flagellar protein FliS